MVNSVKVHSLFSDFDINLFKAGKHFKLYEKLGSHLIERQGDQGCYFAVYAPSAFQVEVIGNFNYWTGDKHQLYVRWDGSGIWEGFIPGIKKGETYKYRIYSNNHSQVLEKADPFAKSTEHPPKTGSIVWDSNYKWKDKKWMNKRLEGDSLNQPYSVYEIHLGSWKKNIDENRSLSYIELATELVDYISDMGYTHVEFMPVMEHPYDPSWGYQVTSYFAPTSRFGSPDEFKILVDALHGAGIGVILDWVPAHFPSDDFALANFDGTHVYEHPDRRKGYHPDWKSLIFNFERNEVRAFLISSALFWMEEYHADGLRVDAVASILYLDYSREEGEWEPNEYGGRENLAAISFLKDFNEAVYTNFPNTQTIAEESTSFTGVTTPVFSGGLGFGMKWMMGWMNDTLEYFKKEPVHRKFHQNSLTFSMVYAFTENFMLPISHDEVVHGKNSILNRMPGDEWQKFANLRVLYSYMFSHPGTKLLFMGCDFGQSNEWNFQESLDWHLLQYDVHKGIQNLIRDLNNLYKTEKALYEASFNQEGFEWIDYGDHENSVISYLRKSKSIDEQILIVCNLTPVPRLDYVIGCPKSKEWEIIMNSDDGQYSGSEFIKEKTLKTKKKKIHGREHAIQMTLPPLSVIYLKKKK